MITLYQEDLIDVNLVKSRSSWFEYHLNPFCPRNSTYACYYCRKYSAYFNILQPNDLSKGLGVLKGSKQANRNVIESHHRLQTHKKIMEYLTEKKNNNMDSTLGDSIQARHFKFHKCISTIYT